MKNVENLITQSTMAIFPAYDEAYSSIILDQSGEEYYSHKTTMMIIKDACISGGAAYKGRIEAVRKTLGYHGKTPLMINQQDLIYAFPTISAEHFDCIWLFNRHIKNFSSEKEGNYVHFKNGDKRIVNCSLATLLKQRERTANTMFHFSEPPFVNITVDSRYKEKNLN